MFSSIGSSFSSNIHLYEGVNQNGKKDQESNIASPIHEEIQQFFQDQVFLQELNDSTEQMPITDKKRKDENDSDKILKKPRNDWKKIASDREEALKKSEATINTLKDQNSKLFSNLQKLKFQPNQKQLPVTPPLKIASHITPSTPQITPQVGIAALRYQQEAKYLSTSRFPISSISHSAFLNKSKAVDIHKLESNIVDALEMHLKDKQRFNVLLSGPHGCGKTQLLHSLASCFLEYQPSLSMLYMDARQLIVKSRNALTNALITDSDIKSQLNDIFQCINKIPNISSADSKRYVLCIENIDALISSRAIAYTLSSLLEEHPNTQLIGTTSEVGKKQLETYSIFSEEFQSFHLTLMDEATTLKVLQQRYSSISSQLLETIIRLAQRFLHNKSDPLRSIELIEASFSFNSLKKNSSPISEETVRQVIANQTKVPLSKIQEEIPISFKSLERKLSKAVIGQDHIIKSIAKDILCIKRGWNDPNKPPMVYVFAGPTGVGKTELAKRIAKVVFGNMNHFIRLDMAEYHEAHTKSRLIGSPPGYVGYDEGGQLTEALAKNPSSVVLLDEIEKADREVLKLFLPVFDEGRITDSKGKLINCKNTCFIMTTNLGAQQIQEKAQGKAWDTKEILSVINPLISNRFGPEWINRVTVLPFLPLTREKSKTVVQIHLEKLNKEFKAQKRISLSWSDEVVEWLANKGFNPDLGARPLIKTINDFIRKEIALACTENPFKQGDLINCYIDHNEDKIQFSQQRSL